MTLERTDISPLQLDGSITTSSELELAHDGDLLSDYSDKLFNGLDNLTSAEVTVPDFTEGSTTHAMHAWTVNGDGSLTKWSRQSASSVSGSQTQFNADVVVVAVPPGVSVPEEPDPEGPPAPGTTQKKVRVKIDQEGELPLR